KRLPIGKILPFYGRHDSSLHLTRQLAWTEERKGQVWTAIIAQKITNQSLHLAQRDYSQKAAALLAMRAELRLFDPANREGHA
ncbi:subtype II CRISPR-associated endonuclease Cas1, partial [Enterococcus faecalis]